MYSYQPYSSPYSRCRDPASQPFGLTLSWSDFRRKAAGSTQQPVALLTYEGHSQHHEVIAYDTDATDDYYEGGDRTPEQIGNAIFQYKTLPINDYLLESVFV